MIRQEATHQGISLALKVKSAGIIYRERKTHKQKKTLGEKSCWQKFDSTEIVYEREG